MACRLVFVILSTVPVLAQGTNNMPIDMNQFHLPDNTFWNPTGFRANDPVVAKNRDSYFGIVIDAPREVNVKTKKTLPAFVYYMGNNTQKPTRSLDHQGAVIAVDVVENELYLGPASVAVDTGEEVIPMDTGPVAGIDPQGRGTSVETHVLDLRERLALPWKPAQLLIQGILLDMPSPRIETRLVPGGMVYEDPEVTAFLEKERRRQDPPAIDPRQTFAGSVYPSYRKGQNSPELPPTPGIALKTERVVRLEDNKPVLLSGAWRLPLEPIDLVKPAHRDYNEANGLLDSEGKPYPAVVKIHIVYFGTAREGAFRFWLVVPAEEIHGTDQGPEATGYFTIDLRRIPQFPLVDQTVFLYPFSRAETGEKAILGIVDKRR